jgi:hypothetical protein
MSEHDDCGPAFPREDYQTDNAGGQCGMTLRDYFAAKAMQGFCATAAYSDKDFNGEAAGAYRMADAMIAAREQKQ